MYGHGHSSCTPLSFQTAHILKHMFRCQFYYSISYFSRFIFRHSKNWLALFLPRECILNLATENEEFSTFINKILLFSWKTYRFLIDKSMFRPTFHLVYGSKDVCFVVCLPLHGFKMTSIIWLQRNCCLCDMINGIWLNIALVHCVGFGDRNSISIDFIYISICS